MGNRVNRTRPGIFLFWSPNNNFFRQSDHNINTLLCSCRACCHCSFTCWISFVWCSVPQPDKTWIRVLGAADGAACKKMTCNRRVVRPGEFLALQRQCCFQLWIRIFSSDYLKRPNHVWGERNPPSRSSLKAEEGRKKKIQFVVLKILKAPFRLEQHAPPRLASPRWPLPPPAQSEHIWWTYS